MNMKMVVFWFAGPYRIITLMMETVTPSKKFVSSYQSTRYYNPKTTIFVLTAVRISNPTQNNKS
jgi:hypothetical protein